MILDSDCCLESVSKAVKILIDLSSNELTKSDLSHVQQCNSSVSSEMNQQ